MSAGVLLPSRTRYPLAKAVAGEAGVPFFTMSGSGIREMFVEGSAAEFEGLFGNAKKNAPAIIFIDKSGA